MSVDSLSREVNITPMGVRQHLLVLERNGFVEYATQKHGVGRPGFIYRLTATADDLFPKAYREFALETLEDLESTEGRSRIDGLFRRRKERIVAGLSTQLQQTNGLSGRLNVLVERLREDGGIVDLEEKADLFRLKQYNCPLSQVASRFREICDHELQMLREITLENVTREQCLANGDNACVYMIPKGRGTHRG